MQKVDGKERKNDKNENEKKIEKCITDIGAQVCHILLPPEQKVNISESAGKKVKIQSLAKIKPQNELPLKKKPKHNGRVSLDIGEREENTDYLIKRAKEAERKKNMVRTKLT